MDNTAILVIILAILILVVAGGAMLARRRRSEALRRRFGPEYDRAVGTTGDRAQAEAELAAREKRVAKLDIRDFPEPERRRFAEAWHDVQARFVDSPAAAVKEADRLVKELMQAKGYPMGDFEQRAADVSVDYPHVVTNYRAARAIAHANERGEATTEHLREAMVHYRGLFEELLGAQAVPPPAAGQASVPVRPITRDTREEAHPDLEPAGAGRVAGPAPGARPTPARRR